MKLNMALLTNYFNLRLNLNLLHDRVKVFVKIIISLKNFTTVLAMARFNDYLNKAIYTLLVSINYI